MHATQSTLRRSRNPCAKACAVRCRLPRTRAQAAFSIWLSRCHTGIVHPTSGGSALLCVGCFCWGTALVCCICCAGRLLRVCVAGGLGLALLQVCRHDGHAADAAGAVMGQPLVDALLVEHVPAHAKPNV